MSINHGRQVYVAEHNSAGGDLDIDRQSFRFERPIFVVDVSFIGYNPSDTDTDTTAIDVSYSTDGFSGSNVEIAALSAQEYNDTTRHAQFAASDRIAANIALTSPTTYNGISGVLVLAGAVVEITMTNVGAGVDTRYSVVVEFIVL